MPDQPKINPKIVIGIFVELVFVVIIIFLFSLILNKENDAQPSISVENFQVEGLSTEASKMIERDVYNAVSLNNGALSNISGFGALVRDGSVINTEISELDLHYLYLIVDVPSMEQSYQVRYVWSDDASNKNVPTNTSLMTMCLPEDRLIYGDFGCKDDYNHAGPEIALYSLAYKLSFKTKTNVSYEVAYHGNPSIVDSDFYFKLQLNSCGDEAKNQQVITAFENWVGSLGFEPSEIRYKFIGYCDI